MRTHAATRRMRVRANAAPENEYASVRTRYPSRCASERTLHRAPPTACVSRKTLSHDTRRKLYAWPRAKGSPREIASERTRIPAAGEAAAQLRMRPSEREAQKKGEGGRGAPHYDCQPQSKAKAREVEGGEKLNAASGWSQNGHKQLLLLPGASARTHTSGADFS